MSREVPDQRWFRHPEMQARIVEAEADFAAGRSVRTTTPEEAQAFLEILKSSRPQENT